MRRVRLRLLRRLRLQLRRLRLLQRRRLLLRRLRRLWQRRLTLRQRRLRLLHLRQIDLADARVVYLPG